MPETRRKDDPDSRLALILLRYWRGWNHQADLKRVGVSQSQVSSYDRGERAVPREVLERVARAAGFPPELLDLLLKGIRTFRATGSGRGQAVSRGLMEEIASDLSRLVRSAALAVLAGDERRTGNQSIEPLSANEMRLLASTQWTRLRARTFEERQLLVEESGEYRGWALCERLAAESVAEAGNRPKEALQLAQLALRIAERESGDEACRRRLRGYAWAHIANALRACNELRAAEEAMTRARILWEAGASADPRLLNEGCLPWLEAVLRRDQRRLTDALQRSDEALALDNGDLRSKILVSKAIILKDLGNPDRSMEVLEQAAPLIDGSREPRLALGLRFNLVADMCDLGKVEAAQSCMAGVRQLAEDLGEQLDLARVAWLQGKIAAASGRLAEAGTAFDLVRQQFLREELVYDYALASLDRALVLLNLGQTTDVRRLAEEVLGIFKIQGVQREALAALEVLCEAARREAVTVHLIQRVSAFLLRAQQNPHARFEK